MIQAAQIAIAVVAALLAWTVQGWRMDAKLAEVRTEYATAQARAVERAHSETIRLQAQADAAAKQHAARQAKMAHDVKRSDTALGLLHDAAASAISAAKDSHAACQSNVAALSVVSTECGSAVNSLARDAQGWLNESVMLREAWPK